MKKEEKKGCIKKDIIDFLQNKLTQKKITEDI